MNTMSVTVRDRRTVSPWALVTRTVQIGTHCPECGGLRGQPRSSHYCEDGQHYWVDNWENPCGHVDYYDDVLEEAEALVRAAQER